jgi:pyridoxal phosphate-dependent aminotransferase EpsN
VGAGRTPKAVIVVNLYGQSADYDPIKEICARYGVALLEDAAESLGSTYKGRASGTLGTVGIFSFNGNKIITTSGGGMIVSQDEAAIARCRFLSTQAREPVPHYEHAEIGYNYRMSNILAGVGRGQLRVLDERIAARRLVFDHYQEGLADLPGVSLMPEASYGRSNRWLTALRVDPDRWGIGPDEICRALNLRGIEARRIWKPMHLQPVFRQARYYAQSSNDSISDRIYDTGLCLPSGSNTTHDERRRVIKAFRQVIGASA